MEKSEMAAIGALLALVTIGARWRGRPSGCDIRPPEVKAEERARDASTDPSPG